MFKERKDAIKYSGMGKIIGLTLLMFLLGNIVIEGVTSILGDLVFGASESQISIGSTFAMILNVVIMTVIMMLVSKIKLKDLGLDSKAVIKNILIGAISGILVLTVVGLSIKMMGAVTIVSVYKSSYLKMIIVSLIFFIFQGTFEELVFRSFIMTQLSKKFGDFLGIILSALLFISVHLLNPGISYMAILNLLIASIVFSMVYYVWGNLWLSGLAHGLWNYTQSVIFGSSVSGLTLTEKVLLSTPVNGKDLISGGVYGFEGGIVTSIMGIILIVVLIIVAMKKNNCSCKVVK
ncbi:CPBP family intramembrane glutamic endopeptidase [Oceanivirga miroungae]|uniref:CAAX prenyl protease 2/Lysostaphin resistance protein A-like domain-containing protein n=1 Tax=Oceanivirga miroungae TaxID=1130046 RepID=A0A6I8M6K2_9FUSO|nr:type II CAAX endopeptidase family protein [Oceanivirga miroungae]VWL85003.1 hypothetical protein OMES3154_00275 [Oceanivirga miroungae]